MAAPEWLFLSNYYFPGKYHGESQLWFQQPAGWAEAFGKFWLNLQDRAVKRHALLDIAMRRYSYAHERHRNEDKIIDLLIAAEALFMSDYDPKMKPYLGELRYRLSERAGLFLGGSDMTICRMVFQHIRTAYDLRSAIVHGGKSDEIKLPNKLDDTRMSLEEFVWKVQEYMRIAICKAITLALQPQATKALVNWDELIFSIKEKE